MDIDPEFIWSREAVLIAVCFSTLATIISIGHVTRHILYYTMPGIQVYVIRILLIVPVYAITSALALSLGHDGMYAESIRDIMEAVVIYTFLLLMLEFCGGETDCVYQIEDEPMLVMPFPLCRQKRPRDARLIHFCQRSVLQFVIIKVIMALLAVTMLSLHLYVNEVYQGCVMFVYNITYSIALYGLMVFFYATKHLLQEFHPVGKFVSVKLIIFATYFQSVIVSMCPIPVEEALMWNDFILCIEMVIFATILCFAFPVSEFQGGMPESRVLESVKDVISVSDVFDDVYHSFTPRYDDYSVQRQESEVPTQVGRLGSLDGAAVEMSRRYRGRNRRLEFNSLLRGSTPIVATLRSKGNARSSATTSGSSDIQAKLHYGPLSPSDDVEAGGLDRGEGNDDGDEEAGVLLTERHDDDDDDDDDHDAVLDGPTLNALHRSQSGNGSERSRSKSNNTSNVRGVGSKAKPSRGHEEVKPLRDAGAKLKLSLQQQRLTGNERDTGQDQDRSQNDNEELGRQESLEWGEFTRGDVGDNAGTVDDEDVCVVNFGEAGGPQQV